MPSPAQAPATSILGRKGQAGFENLKKLWEGTQPTSCHSSLASRVIDRRGPTREEALEVDEFAGGQQPNTKMLVKQTICTEVAQIDTNAPNAISTTTSRNRPAALARGSSPQGAQASERPHARSNDCSFRRRFRHYFKLIFYFF